MASVSFESARLVLARLAVGGAAGRQAAFDRVLRLCAETLGVERVGLWLFTPTEISCRDVYVRSRDAKVDGGVLDATRIPAYWKAMHERRVIIADDARRHDSTRELDPWYLGPLEISSMLDAPVFRAGSLHGILCHEHVGPVRAWTSEEIHFAGAAADTLSSVLEQADRLEAEEQLKAALGHRVVAQQLLVLEQLARAVAHDFANVLTGVVWAAVQLRARGETELSESLESAVHVARGLLGQLGRFGSRSSPSVPLPLVDIVERIEPILSTLTRDRAKLTVEVRAARSSVAAAPTDEVEQIILNLVVNARDATGPAGEIRMTVEEAEGSLWIEVADNGSGIPPEILDRIWDANFTTKASGTGLGLATVRSIVDRAHGGIAVSSSPGRGTTFRVRLPKVPS
jgi:signal transduction histidine kinase